MQMSKEEIVRRYQEAKYKSKQVQILAELNGCDKETIQEVLRQSRIEIQAAKAKKTAEKPIKTKSEGKPADRNPVSKTTIPEAVKQAVITMLEKKRLEIEADRQALEEKTRTIKELEDFLQKC